MEKLMTVVEVAERLGLHPETIRRAVRDKRLAHYRFPGCIRISADQLSNYLAANLSSAREQPVASEEHAERASPVAEFQRSRRFSRALGRKANG